LLGEGGETANTVAVDIQNKNSREDNRRACPILARLILHINVLIEMKICFIILSDSFTALFEFVSRSISGKIGKNLYLLLI